MFTNGLPIWEVLCSVDDEDEGSNLGAVDAHIREDTGRVHTVQWVGWFRFGRHVALSYLPALIGEIGIEIVMYVSKELASKGIRGCKLRLSRLLGSATRIQLLC